MTKPCVQDGWLEPIAWGVTGAALGAALIAVLLVPSTPKPRPEAAELIACYHTLADMDSAITVKNAWNVCRTAKHVVPLGCGAVTYYQVGDTLTITALCPEGASL